MGKATLREARLKPAQIKLALAASPPAKAGGKRPKTDAWEDFHHELLTRARAQLEAQVGPAYYVKVESPVTLTMPALDFARESWLEVRDRRDRRVITAIELLSPGNKNRAEHREAYLAKRNEILAGSIHLVEIDLLRGGERPSIPMLPKCDYYVLVSRLPSAPPTRSGRGNSFRDGRLCDRAR